MAGTERPPSGRGRSATAAPSERLSTSMDVTLDLLTGLGTNSFAQESSRSAGVAAIDAQGDRHQTTSPTTRGAGLLDAAEGNPSGFQRNLIYSSHEPLDLLTGLFHPVAPSPPPTSTALQASPHLSACPQGTSSQQEAWGADGLLGQPAFGFGNDNFSSGSSLDELFGASNVEIAPNNPFLGNASRSPPPAYSSPAPAYPIAHNRAADDAAGADVPHRISMSDSDGSFAKFPPHTETGIAAAADSGRRFSYSGGNAAFGPVPTSKILRTQSVSNGEANATSSANSSSLAGDSFSKPKLPSGRLFSATSGSGLVDRIERMQNNGPLRAESSSSISYSPVSPSSPTESSRKTTPETKYEHWMPPSEAGTSSWATESSPRTSTTSPQSGAGDDEYIGATRNSMYEPPVRGAVHPRRPVSLELRPHPLRGAPANQVTLLTCLDGSVWAVCDMGLMVWDIANATGSGSIAKANNPGDEDAADYELLRVHGSSAFCIVADVANHVVWTGHRDGKIRCWPGFAAPSASREPRSATLTFQALQHAVTAILFTPYGELWAGSESGDLRAWPWNAVAKALTRVGDCASLMEKSYNNLSLGNLGVAPNGLTISPEIRFLVGDHAHGRVWCAGSQYMAIWDARTRERIKMFVGFNGSDVNSTDFGSPGRETILDEDLKLGYAKVSNKKDKGGWLQRSRIAVLGAADAVRRAASGVTHGFEEDRKLKALVAAADGTMWGGYGNGVLTQWDWAGNRIRDGQSRPVGVKSLCVVGSRLWVGYSDGKLDVLAGDTGKIVGSWLAHRLAVIDMAVSGGHIFSLGMSGSIRGWNISYPNSKLDQVMKAAMTNRADRYTRKENLQVLVGTWNTAQEKASLQSTKIWLAPAAEASIVAVGLQEVEMGAGAIGMAAVKETVGMEKGSATGHWWLSHIDHVLGEEKEFERLGSRQLAGMVIGVWVRRKLLPHVGDVEVGAVACGFGRAFGNKGAVGVKLNIFRRTICVLTSHLAAHMEHTSRRNADFEHIYNQMTFSRVTRTNSAAAVSNVVQNMLRGGNTPRRVSVTSDQNFLEKETASKPDLKPVDDEDAGLPELADADLLIWTGDLNYRINLSYDDVMNHIKKEQWDTLLSRDQLRFEMKNGRTFQGLREAAIRFPPTYKFDKWSSFYDTSEKKRVPAWCDRVLFRDSFGSGKDYSNASKQGLLRPCKASVVRYEACMEPEDSDHKPVRCMLRVDLSVTDEADRRYQYGHIIHHDPQAQKCIAESGVIPETSISTNRLVVEESAQSVLRLSSGLGRAVYVIQCEGASSSGPCPCGKHSNLERTSGEDQYPRGGYGFPPWLQVDPAAGVLEPGVPTSISVKIGMRPEDRDKSQLDNLLVLVVNVKGVHSSEYKQHRICVSRASSGQILAKEKERSRRRSQEQQRRPSAESDSQGYSSRTGHGSSSFTNTPDLLL